MIQQMLAIGPVSSEATVRRILQRLDAHAFDELAAAWGVRATSPVPREWPVTTIEDTRLLGATMPLQEVAVSPLPAPHSYVRV